MKVKVSEVSGSVLDWMVAKCEGRHELAPFWVDDDKYGNHIERPFSPSTDWAQGGPIIEREHIHTIYDSEWVYDPTSVDPDDEHDNGDRWYAEIRRGSYDFFSNYGPTPLVAAMRCYVINNLGGEVEVPGELQNG